MLSEALLGKEALENDGQRAGQLHVRGRESVGLVLRTLSVLVCHTQAETMTMIWTRLHQTARELVFSDMSRKMASACDRNGKA